MDLQGAFLCHFFCPASCGKLGVAICFFTKIIVVLLLLHLFISAKEPGWPKWFGDRTKKGREAICHLFVFVFVLFAC
jgi:hypothetical protein